MSTSHRLSSASATCRLEWRPSRLIAGWLASLAMLCPICLLASGLPRWLAWPLALAAAAWGLRLAWREAGRAPRWLVLADRATGPGDGIASHAGPDTLDGRPLARCEIAWRGPLAFVHAVDDAGRHQRLAWWPDTLPAARRRELRLAAAARGASRHGRPMAP